MSRRLQEIRQRGGKVILIDPRFNRNCAPGRSASVHKTRNRSCCCCWRYCTLFLNRRLARPGPLAAFTKGVETIGKLVAEFPPEKVASITGIDADQIRLLAREFAAAESAVCYGRIGVSTQEFGGVCQWLINVLNMVTGNLDSPGGAMFTLPAFDPMTAPESSGAAR